MLFISPTPTHPANAGNRVHIMELSKLLKKHGFDVSFLYLAFENFDQEKMVEYWGDRLHIINKDALVDKGPLVRFYFKRCLEKLRKLQRHLQLKVGIITKFQLKYNNEVDGYFPRNIKKNIRDLQASQHFDIVICEYAAMSKALTFFDDSVFKILDTHDGFTDRFNVYLKNNLTPDWFTFYRSQEGKALQRADLVIAVQDEEKKYFSGLTKSKVIRYCTVYEPKKMPPRLFEKKLLYFASNNLINNITLKKFESEIMPLIKSKHPDVQLLVGGSICNSYVPLTERTHLTGMVDDPSDFYSSGDIVINPEYSGTGYKIKTMEALCYGMPMVCTNVGAVGLTEPYNEHFLLANDPEGFCHGC